MRGKVAKRLRREVMADHPGEWSELVAVRVPRRGTNLARRRRRRRSLVAALVASGKTREQAERAVPEPLDYAIQAVSRGPRAEYQRRKRAHTRRRRR